MRTKAFTRRKLLQGTGAVGAGAVLGAPIQVAAQGPEIADFCIVGAGYAGLTAADLLLDSQYKVIVLEARNRVGGRTWTIPWGGEGWWLDYGGQWVGPQHTNVQRLAARFGIQLYESYRGGADLYVPESGPAVRLSSSGLPAGLESLAPALDSFAELASSVPAATPWTAPNAADLDQQTVATWMKDKLPTKAARAMFQHSLSGLPIEASLLFALHGLNACSGFEGVEGSQQFRISGGGQSIPIKMAARLGPALRLGSPVRRIIKDDNGVTVISDTATVRARRVIVAIPPVLTAGIAFIPPLPSERTQFIQRFPQAVALKFMFTYLKPFWRDNGLSGASMAVDSPVESTADSGFPESDSPGVLTGFAHNDMARQLARLDADGRRETLRSALVARFGPEAASPRNYLEKYWVDEEWSRGCFSGFGMPGTLTAFTDSVRRPVDRIHWAGTETSDVWPGYIEGAIRSGMRVAQEVSNAEIRCGFNLLKLKRECQQPPFPYPTPPRL